MSLLSSLDSAPSPSSPPSSSPTTVLTTVLESHNLQTEFNVMTFCVQIASRSRYVPEFISSIQQAQRVLVNLLKLLDSRRVKKDWFNFYVPPVLMCDVSKFLDVRDLMRLECVCRVWKNNLVTPSIADRLWRRIWRSCEWGQVSRISDPTPWRDHVRSRLEIERNWGLGKYKIQHVVNHGGLVHAVSFAQDILTTGGNDRKVRLWDLKTGNCTTVLSGHNDWVRTVKLCADTSLVLSGSDDQTIKIWNVLTGICSSTLQGHRSAVVALATLPDKNRLGSASDDNTIKEWDIERGECIQTLCGHTSTIWSIGAHEKQLVSGSNDTTVKDWSLDTGQCIRTFQGHTSVVHAVNVDSRRIVSGSADDSLRVWEKRQGSCMAKLVGHSGSVRSIGVEGRRIVSGSFDGSIKIWDIGRPLWEEAEAEEGEKEDSTEEIDHKRARQREMKHFESLRHFKRTQRKVRQKGVDRDLDRSRENSLVRGLDSSRENSLVQTSTENGGTEKENSKARNDEKRSEGQGSGCVLIPSGHMSGSRASSESPGLKSEKEKLDFLPEGRQADFEPKTVECVRTLDDHEDHVLALQCDTLRLISGDWNGKVIIRHFGLGSSNEIEGTEDSKENDTEAFFENILGSTGISGKGTSKHNTREARSFSESTLPRFQKTKPTLG